MRSSPRCPRASCKALSLKTSRRFLPHCDQNVADLESIAEKSSQEFIDPPSTLRHFLGIIHSSPAYHSKIVNQGALGLKFPRLISRAPVKTDITKVAYDVFFDNIHPKGSAQLVLAQRFRRRWCSDSLVHVKSRHDKTWSQLAGLACKYLHLLSRRVPSRVHLANVRLHYNGWHTEARCQHRSNSKCVFCRGRTQKIALSIY